MEFPKTIEEFISEHSFEDREEVYTNGSELIQVFRVNQALEHYMRAERDDAIDEFEEKLLEKVESFKLEIEGVIKTDILTLDYFMEFVSEIAEQLKGGINNE